MRTSGVKYIDGLWRLASVLATFIAAVVFAMVTSVNAAPLDKKVEVKDKAKIEKVEKVEKAEEVEAVEVEEIEELEALEAPELGELGGSRGFNRLFIIDKNKFKKDR